MNFGLEGENQIGSFRQTAERLVPKITAIKTVGGIVFLGGLVRGFADKFSDLDITVFLSSKDKQSRMKIYRIGLEESRHSAVEIDLEVHFLEDFKRHRWNETERWDFSNARLVFDPKGEIRKMIKAKLKVPKRFWTRRIGLYSEYIKWYCCSPKNDVGTIAETWIQRGDLISAHYCLDYSVELLLKLIFAINKEFLPPPKWRIFYSSKLKWLPKKYNELLTKAMSHKNMSLADFHRRFKAIRKTWHEILPRMEYETKMTPNQMSRYYVRRILRQTQIPLKSAKKDN